MNTFKSLSATAALILGAAGVASAANNELLLTGATSKAGGRTAVALDISSNGEARGFQAIIPLPKGMTVDTSRCLGGLPKGFQGVCNAKDGEVRIMAFSFGDVTLPAGVASIGVLEFSGSFAKAGLKVESLQLVDGAGKELSFGSNVDVEGAQHRPGNDRTK